MALAIYHEAAEKRRDERKGAGIHDRGYVGPRGAELEKLLASQRSPRPDRPCSWCGSADYCRHVPRPEPVSHGFDPSY